LVEISELKRGTTLLSHSHTSSCSIHHTPLYHTRISPFIHASRSPFLGGADGSTNQLYLVRKLVGGGRGGRVVVAATMARDSAAAVDRLEVRTSIIYIYH